MFQPFNVKVVTVLRYRARRDFALCPGQTLKRLRRTSYFPKMTQSPCDVPMKSSIGSDNHAFVREAINA